MSTRVHTVMGDELLERLDSARGLVPRSAWIREAVEAALVDPGRHGRSSRPAPASPPAPNGKRLLEKTEEQLDQEYADRMAEQ